MNLLFDSNVFDELVSGNLSIDYFKGNSIKIFVTHIQIDELKKCSDIEKRDKLLQSFVEIQPIEKATESFGLGVSRFNSAKLSDGILIDKLRNGNLKRTNDALIAETAIKNEFTLITNDKDLRRNVRNLGGMALFVEELKAELK